MDRRYTTPVYDDGSLVVFGIENFFDPNFTLLDQIQSPCVMFKDYPKSFGAFSFHEASGMLRSRSAIVKISRSVEIDCICFSWWNDGWKSWWFCRVLLALPATCNSLQAFMELAKIIRNRSNSSQEINFNKEIKCISKLQPIKRDKKINTII